MYPPYATQNLISTTEFKTYTPIADTSRWSDATLSGYISQATRWIQNYCQVDGFLTTTVSGERGISVITGFGDMFIFPRIRPITQGSITAIRLVKGGFSTSLTLSGSNGALYYQVPYPYTYLSYPSSYLAGTGTLMIGGSTQLVTLRDANTYYEIDYSGGFATAPEDLKMACMLMTTDYLNRYFNSVGADSVHQGDIGFSLGGKDESNFVLEACEILDNGGYVRTAMGA